MATKHDLSKAVSYASSRGQSGDQALQGTVWTRRQGKRFLFETGLGCQLVSFVTLLISFCSPYWIISWPRVYSSFKRVGLWEACFAGMVLETDSTSKSYHGCWWIFAPEFWDIRGWLMPWWFILVQVLVTICLVGELVGFAINFVIWLRTGGSQKDGRYKQRDPLGLLRFTTWITLVTSFLMAGGVILFAVAFKVDKQWLPNTYFNYLSWSYGLAVISTFFSYFTLITHMTYMMIVRKEMMLPPPSVNMAGTYPRVLDTSI